MFRQIDYLFLFDSELGFSKRDDFNLEDAHINVEDFKKMRLINRTKLTEFLQQNDTLVHPTHLQTTQTTSIINDYQMKEKEDEIENNSDSDSLMMDGGSEEHEHWADELLDEEIKSLLALKSNGARIPLDIVAHFEYFYNTLDC